MHVAAACKRLLSHRSWPRSSGLVCRRAETKDTDKYDQLSYRRETALQSGLVLAKSERLEPGDNILRTL